MLNRLAKKKEVAFYLKVRAGAAKTELKGTLDDGTIKMSVAAKPEDGKANKQIIRFFSKELGVDPEKIEIMFGHTSSMKRVKIVL